VPPTVSTTTGRRVDEAGEHYPETGSRQISHVDPNRLDYPWVKVRQSEARERGHPLR
jgi:hypothetical protein